MVVSVGTVRAAICERYGGPDMVRVGDVEAPVPARGEILIRVRAATVSSADCRIRSANFPSGFGLLGRLAFGISGPRRTVLGTDLSGVVEAVGKDVARFRAGDEVFGSVGARLGSHAELAVVRETGAIVRKPAALSFEEAAALPFGGATALHFLRDVGRVRTGERVLITGASGAVGSAAVQIAKNMGAHVTGMASGRNAATVRALGADEVIDREITDLAATGLRWDVVVDVANVVPFARGRSLLVPGGRLLLVAASLWALLAAPARSRTGRFRVAGGIVPERADDILALGRLAETGAIRVVIDSRFPLARIAEAHARASSGKKVGNVLVTMGSD